MENLKHIQVPSDKTKEKITPKDLLIYCVLKEYENWETHETFVGISAIGDKLGLSSPTVSKSLKALAKEDYIEIIQRKGKSNVYRFNPYKNFEGFSPEFLDNSSLSANEKAYLIAMQQYMRTEDGEVGKISFSNKDISEKINLSENTIRKLDNSLKAKNYLTIVDNKLRDIETGCSTKTKIFDLNKYGQEIVFLLRSHHEQISQNTEDIANNEARITKLEQIVEQQAKENRALRDALYKNNYKITQIITD